MKLEAISIFKEIGNDYKRFKNVKRADNLFDIIAISEEKPRSFLCKIRNENGFSLRWISRDQLELSNLVSQVTKAYKRYDIFKVYLF